MAAITPAYAQLYQAPCLPRRMPAILGKNSVYRSPTPDIRIFPMLVPQHVKEALISEDGPFIQTEVLASRMVKLSLGGGSVIARSLHGRIGDMFGLVITNEAHLAFSGARTHSNNTAEMTAMIEALAFLGPHGPVARDVESCV